MSSSDKTKELLEQMLAQLHSEQAKETKAYDGSYLIAEDGQLLGKITDNIYDTDSILNQYGPYGSQYSTTSIFNPYSQYGSEYGSYSLNNPYTTTPPKLFINSSFLGYVTANQHTQNRISPEAFFYTLENDFNSLLSGVIVQSETQARKLQRESFIEAQDGTFLGKLTPNKFESNSIFNKNGAYGNKFSQTSIYNNFSDYGSQFSEYSPYNKFSNSPPKAFVNGEFVAYLTKNKFIEPRIDPDDIMEWSERNISTFG
ncbi:MAG: hypothetical protein ACI9T7_001373 [Oleiphilaceae bacterium]|jgi:hypothetical protein